MDLLLYLNRITTNNEFSGRILTACTSRASTKSHDINLKKSKFPKKEKKEKANNNKIV